MSTSVLRAPSARFLAAASLVVAICAVLLRSQAFARNPDVAAWGITFDLTLTIPLLYWFLVVRPGHAPAMTLAPVFVVCTILATALIPRSQQQFVRDLDRFAIPLAEIGLVAAIVLRVRRARGENAIRALLGDNRIADVVESELLMLYYAFFCWRKKPEETAGRAMTFHERSGWGTILVCIYVLLAAEGLGMHLLLGHWKTAAAWVWTALDLWAAVWLLGDYHGLRLRRSFVTEEALSLRFGMRWSVDVPLNSIESIDAVREEKQWKRRGVLKIAILDEPRYLVTLREPLVAKGLAGLRKTITALALLPDDDEAISALQRALSRRDTP